MQMRDLIDLVRAGLKPAEIKEMIELEKQVKDIDIENKEEVKEEQPKEEPVVKQEPEPEDNTAEELKKAHEELVNIKAQLTAIQNENKNKDISGNQDKTLDEQLVDIFSKLV